MEGEGGRRGWRGRVEGKGGGRGWTFVYRLSSLSNSVIFSPPSLPARRNVPCRPPTRGVLRDAEMDTVQVDIATVQIGRLTDVNVISPAEVYTHKNCNALLAHSEGADFPHVLLTFLTLPPSPPSPPSPPLPLSPFLPLLLSLLSSPSSLSSYRLFSFLTLPLSPSPLFPSSSLPSPPLPSSSLTPS